jgi:hypothetical protein
LGLTGSIEHSRVEANDEIRLEHRKVLLDLVEVGADVITASEVAEVARLSANARA